MPRRLLLFVSVVVFADTAFYAAITPILPDLSREFSLSKGEAGLVSGAFAVGTFLAAIPSGVMAARVGVKPTVVFGLALLGASCAAFALAESALALELSRFAQGVGSAASWAGALAWLIGAAPADRRGELIGSALGAAIAGALCGPVLGAAAEAAGRGVVFGAVAVGAAGVLGWALRLPAVEPEGVSMPALRRSAREREVVLGMWLMSLPALMFGVLVVLAPLRLDELGAGAAVIGGAFLAGGALEAGISPVVGRMSDRRGRLAPALVFVPLSGLVMFAMPWPDVTWLLAAAIVVACPVIGSAWAPAMALISEGAERVGVAQGLAFGLVNLAWAAGQSTGSALGSRLADATSDAAPYLVLAGLATLTALALPRFSRPRAEGRNPAWP